MKAKNRIHLWLALFLAMAAMPSWGQTMGFSVSGEVRDAETGKRLQQASISTPDGH